MKKPLALILALLLALSAVGALAEESIVIAEDADAQAFAPTAEAVEIEVDMAEVGEIEAGIQKVSAESEPVPNASKGTKIDKKHFPDAAFREYVKRFDTDGNGYLSKAEAKRVDSIVVGSGTNEDVTVLCKNIKGIEYFPNLEELIIAGEEKNRHPLKSMDISKNKKLVNLVVTYTNIKKLDISKNKNLCWAFVNNNRLTKLTLGKNKKLMELICRDNRISKLDLTKCTNMGILGCGNNKLKSLNVTRNKNLNTLDASGNSKLKKLDIGKCKKLVNIVKKGEMTSGDGYVKWRDPKEDDPDDPEWTEKYNYKLRIPATCKLYSGKKVLYKGK